MCIVPGRKGVVCSAEGRGTARDRKETRRNDFESFLSFPTPSFPSLPLLFLNSVCSLHRYNGEGGGGEELLEEKRKKTKVTTDKKVLATTKVM